jgi:hypothetical protein
MLSSASTAALLMQGRGMSRLKVVAFMVKSLQEKVRYRTM